MTERHGKEASYDPGKVITSMAELRAHYGEPSDKALLKVLDHLSDHYRAFVDACPFVLIASVADEGVDVSPRGDAPGFVRVADAQTLMLPDRKGNNRADTLSNIVRDPRVSLLFLLPGVGETLRVIGRAEVVIDEALCESFAVRDRAPRSVIVVHIEQVYFQCQKALARSRLWSPDSQIERGTLPSAGAMLQAVMADFDGQAYDSGYADYMRETIY